MGDSTPNRQIGCLFFDPPFLCPHRKEHFFLNPKNPHMPRLYPFVEIQWTGEGHEFGVFDNFGLHAKNTFSSHNFGSGGP